MQQLAVRHDQQLAEVQKILSVLKLKQQSDLNRLRIHWNEQDKAQHERVERVIRIEEEKHRQLLEAERKKREEEERQRRLEEERRLAEEAKKRQEEEERQKKKEAEEAAQRAKEEAEREKRALLEAAEKRRNLLGISLPDEDWIHARQTLKVGTVGGHYCGI